MALSDVTVTFDLHQALGSDFDARRTRAYVKFNVDDQTLRDTSTGEIRLGDERVTINDDGTGSFTTWAPGADGNPVSWQTYLVVEYARTGQRDRQTKTFGPYTITASGTLALLDEEQAVPAEYLTQVTDALQDYVDQGAALLAQQEDLSNIDDTDSAVAYNVEFGALTGAALSASTAPARTIDMLAGVPGTSTAAAADGTTDDWTKFTAARTAAGAKGIVHFPARKGATTTTYYLAGSRPDLSGTNITADPNVVIKVDENPNTKTANFLTPVTIQNTVHGTTIRKPPSAVAIAAAELAMAANINGPSGTPIAQDLTTWSGFAVSGALTFGTFTGTVAANSVTWASAFASGQEGIVQNVTIGALYEATVETSAAAPSVFVDLMSSDTVAKRVTWQASGGSPNRILDGGSSTSLADKEPANAAAYRTTTNGSITVGLRVLSATKAEFYINSVLIDTYTLPFSATRIGFSINATASNVTTIKDVVRYDSSQPAAQNAFTVSIVGDSISYGAWSPLTYGDLLPIAMHGLPGGGDVTVRQNLAVSGTTAQDWATPAGTHDIAQYDFSADDYVLVMLGTNDGQGSRTPAQVTADLATIAASIVADGAVPIFGVPPMWTTTSVTGITGVTTTNYNLAQRIRGAIKRWAANTGYQVAEVQAQTGNTLNWLGDNIHPKAVGQAAIAKAFAKAIARSNGGDHPTTEVGWSRWITVPTGWYMNSWVSDDNPQYRTHTDGRVQFRGAIKNGTVGSQCLQVDTALRPRGTTRRIGASLNGTTLTAVAWIATEAGAVTALGGVNNRLSLDGLEWSAV